MQCQSDFQHALVFVSFAKKQLNIEWWQTLKCRKSLRFLSNSVVKGASLSSGEETKLKQRQENFSADVDAAGLSWNWVWDGTDSLWWRLQVIQCKSLSCHLLHPSRTHASTSVWLAVKHHDLPANESRCHSISHIKWRAMLRILISINVDRESPYFNSIYCLRDELRRLLAL